MKKFIGIAVIGLYSILLLQIFVNSVSQLSTMYQQHQLLISSANGIISFSDFVRYYACGKIALSPEAHKCYDAAVQLKYFNEIIFERAGLLIGRPIITHYTPIVYPLTIPIALAPINQAFPIWIVGGFAAVAAGFSLALNTGKQRPVWFSLLAVLGVAATFPTIISLRMGQPSWFILATECLYLWAFVRNRQNICGASVALLCFKPHYGLYFLLPLVIKKKLPALCSFAVTLGLLLLAAGLIIGIENIINYPRFVVDTESNLSLLNYGGDKMVSLRFLCSRIFAEALAVKISLGISLAGLVSAGALWWKFRLCNVHERWLIGCTVLICLLTSPHIYVYDLAMLGVLAVLLGENPVARTSAGRLGCKLFQTLLILYPIVSWIGIMLPSGNTGFPFIAVTYNVLLLVCALTYVFSGTKARAQKLQSSSMISAGSAL